MGAVLLTLLSDHHVWSSQRCYKPPVLAVQELGQMLLEDADLAYLAEMTLLSSQTPSLETSSAVTESPEHRMLEKRSKVIEELLQTERDYIRDLEMCVERIMVPLQQAQVGTWGKAIRWCWWGGVKIQSALFLKPTGDIQLL